MSDSGSSSKKTAGLRHGLSAYDLFVDIVLVLQKVSKVVAIFGAFRRIGED
jgi:hypothetical protein